jgi:hypothetical protein
MISLALSLFNVGQDLRTNFPEEGGNDRIHGGQQTNKNLAQFIEEDEIASNLGSMKPCIYLFKLRRQRFDVNKPCIYLFGMKAETSRLHWNRENKIGSQSDNYNVAQYKWDAVSCTIPQTKKWNSDNYAVA